MIGLVAGVLVIESTFFVERRLKIDDPVGAISVHGVCGLFGVLAVGIFANGKYGAGWNLTTTYTDAAGDPLGVTGVPYSSDGWSQLASQAIGAVTILIVGGGLSFAFFKIQDSVSHSTGRGGIRSTEEAEIDGLDVPEMGVLAYPEFT